jgi:formylglycine-generating enzyme required for sulfatase activity
MKRFVILWWALAVAGGVCGQSTKSAPAEKEKKPVEKKALETVGPEAPPPGMVWIPEGTFLMGSNDKEHEMPVHRVTVKGFWMDATEVTNAQFAAFVKATGHVTTAEKVPKLEDFAPEERALIPPEMLKPGANHFKKTAEPVELTNPLQWWEYKFHANWRQPDGEGSSIAGKDNYPVVCVSFFDAEAYCKWAGKRLPTEAEWERAARGGMEQQKYVWGKEFRPNGKWMCNIWQGTFPVKDAAEDGFHGPAPVKSFPANAYGLYDMSGNVWEWTQDWYSESYYAKSPVENPVNTTPDPNNPQGKPCRTIRGGSWLCNDCYCESYRPAGRQETTPDTSSNHAGFRCVKDGAR